MILVVGGAGYIGSHMCYVLREAGEPHLVVDSFEKGHRQALGSTEAIEADIREPGVLDPIFRSKPVDVVMHFAALIAVGESVQIPSDYWRNNVVGAWNVLESMRKASIDRFVFSSTAAVFGEPQYVPVDEAHPKCPTSPYGDTKLAVERMLAAYCRAYGLRSVCLRYFNAAGATPDGSIGEDHDPETHLIPACIRAATGKTPPLKLYGVDYDTPDGTCVRDYVHVLDLAQAHLAAARRLREGSASAHYNLGNGTGFSVRQVIETVQEVTGLPVPYEEAPRREGDTARLVAGSDLARSELHWRPQFTELRMIVEHAWRWHKAHPDGY